MVTNLHFKRLIVYYADHITPIEVLMMQRFFSLRKINWVKILFIVASRLGDGPLWVLTAAGLLIRGDSQARLAVLTALAAVGISVAVFLSVKNLIGRPRPFETWPGLTCIMAPPDKYSFPSGHTMTAFATWTALSMAIPGLTLPFLLAAILIGFSRVFLGLHYPTDVLMGALMGSGIGLTTSLSASWLTSL